MTAQMQPLTFDCGDAQLLGLLHAPQRPRSRGVVIVAGAPQYRAGSHRHFVLLARDLAAAGFPVLRFDYRGLGDSDGDFVGFEGVSEDLAAAVDAIFARVPGLEDVVLWGLCDGATAICFYAEHDPRVSGIVLVNPWARSDTSLAEARLGHYYRGRILSRELWGKLVRGEADLGRSIRDLAGTVRTVLRDNARQDGTGNADRSAPLPVRVARSLLRFPGRVLIVLSGADLTAQEFDGAVIKPGALSDRRDAAEITLKKLEGANHTYSTRAWREQVHRWTLDWLSRD